MADLLIASNNQGKITEISQILSELDARLWIPKELAIDIEVEESGQTYAENATLKGLAFARASGLITMADDTGLEVQALNGAPGLHSKRIVTQKGATDADRRAVLIDRLREYPPPWLARFVCEVAIVTPEGEVHLFEGICPGEVIAEERGTRGFGYDPIFLVIERGLTMSELGLEEKNRISHRGRAVRAALPVLKTLLNR